VTITPPYTSQYSHSIETQVSRLPISIADKKRILFIAANPSDTQPLKLPIEFRDIEEGLELAQNRDLFDTEQAGATRYKDLRRKLLKYKPHIVHFSGHGTSKGILLEDNQGKLQTVSKERLVELFLQFTEHLECIVFNACDSQEIAQAMSEHIPYVIGMNAAIGDREAIDFAVGFYDGIGDGRTYEDAFIIGKNAINGLPSGGMRGINLPLDKNAPLPSSAIPQLFTQQKQLSVSTLTQNEQDFVSMVFSQLHQGVPQVILSQEGRDTAHMAHKLKEYACISLDANRVLHIYPPANKQAQSTAYFRRLGRQCGFSEPSHDSTEWAGLLADMLDEEDEPVFLLVTDFEKGADASLRDLAAELRQLQEVFNSKLKIIIFGGEKLAEHVFAAGNLSLLNHASTHYVPELKLHDLKENPHAQTKDEQVLNDILLISGRHPLLIRYLLNTRSDENHQQQLVQSSWGSRFFTRYLQCDEDGHKICQWLQQEQISPFEDWPMDVLLRDLYWNNLLVRKQDMLHWRCKMIQQMGRKTLNC